MDEQEIDRLHCGCEYIWPEGGLVSWCGEHTPGIRIQGGDPDRVFRCGECGFVSEQWERLEQHFYGVHLGVRCA